MTFGRSCYGLAMSRDIKTILKATGPSLTSDLIAALTKEGVSHDAARKRVQRAVGDYHRLAGLRFEKNARFVYLDEQYGTPLFWERFEEACQRSGKAYWSTIASLRARGGIAASSLFPRVAGAPLARKGQLSPSRILERLIAVRVLEKLDEGGQDYIKFRPLHYACDPVTTIVANDISENIALHGIKDWARRIGFGSYNKFALRGDDNAPVVSGITWDLSSPSYMRPLVSVTNGSARPGFFVCDINLRDIINRDEAQAFVRKCDLAAAPPKVPPIMPMVVGHVFSSEALQFLKGKGILAVTVRNLFGEELAEALKDLVIMLTDLGARASVEPERILRVMNALTKIEGASDNLRGALFELVVGSLVKDVESGYLKTGERRTDLLSGRKAEIDVQLDRGKDSGILVIECKAKNPGARVSEADVRRWCEDRVPLIYSILSSGGHYREKGFRFELWTNGEFAASALSWFNSQVKDFGTYSVGLVDGAALKSYADKAGNVSLRNTLNEHYFRSALRKAVQ